MGIKITFWYEKSIILFENFVWNKKEIFEWFNSIKQTLDNLEVIKSMFNQHEKQKLGRQKSEEAWFSCSFQRKDAAVISD